MNFYIIIPAYNEETFIGKSLESLVHQTLVPKKVVLVNDNSTDNTAIIAATYAEKYDWITLVNHSSIQGHAPGQKIINAFHKGLATLDDHYDVICKFDADLIFPENYLDTLALHFCQDKKLGMCAGHCYILKNGTWQLESLTHKDHIRGALKAYRKKCFNDIEGLKPAMGWDTIDELLANYHGWHVYTDESLKVKHLKPTGLNYNQKANFSQGKAFYQMRYGFVLTLLGSAKLAFKKKNFKIFIDYLKGYYDAKKKKVGFLVSKEQGDFIRQFRWSNIRKKFF